MDTDAIYRTIPGKLDEQNTYLPLWMHLEDTAYVIEYLCEKRVPDSVIRATGLDRDSFCCVCRFLALTHDLGKATPEFTSKIAFNNTYRKNVLGDKGLIVPALSELDAGRRTPHALAGEVLLRGFGCPDGISSVVGAHHGKPSSKNEDSYDYENQLLAISLDVMTNRDKYGVIFPHTCLLTAICPHLVSLGGIRKCKETGYCITAGCCAYLSHRRNMATRISL